MQWTSVPLYTSDSVLRSLLGLSGWCQHVYWHLGAKMHSNFNTCCS